MRTLCCLLICASLWGCETGKDSHTEVFVTPEQAAAQRGKKLLESHQELAISVLKFSRPDITAKVGQPGQITLAADGVTQGMNLMPIEPELENHSNQERTILRKYLDEQLRPFDQNRVRQLGFDKLKTELRFDLVNDAGLQQIEKTIGAAKLRRTSIVQGLWRVAVLRRSHVEIPVTDDLLAAWHVTAQVAEDAAVEALRDVIKNAGEKLFETTAFSSFGRTGSLNVDPAVILLPEFLAAVQKTWATSDDLLILIPSARSVQFVESRNLKLQEVLMPQWRQLLLSPDALFRLLLLRTPNGLEAKTPEIAQAPVAATKPAATKPETYIVH